MFKLFKQKTKYHHIYLCKRCDIFFEKDKIDSICPICNTPAQIWKVEKVQEKKV